MSTPASSASSPSVGTRDEEAPTEAQWRLRPVSRRAVPFGGGRMHMTDAVVLERLAHGQRQRAQLRHRRSACVAFTMLAGLGLFSYGVTNQSVVCVAGYLVLVVGPTLSREIRQIGDHRTRRRSPIAEPRRARSPDPEHRCHRGAGPQRCPADTTGRPPGTDKPPPGAPGHRACRVSAK